MNPPRSKADILKWNTDVIFGMAEEYGYSVKKNTDFHFSLFHPTRGRMDYFPSTGKAGWFHKNKTYGKSFHIKDIEAYLMEHFNPDKTDKVDPIVEMNKRISDLECRLRKLETLYYTSKTSEDDR